MDGHISELYAIERRVVDISWSRLRDHELYRMLGMATQAGVGGQLFSYDSLDIEVVYRRRLARLVSPCCFVCRRKL